MEKKIFWYLLQLKLFIFQRCCFWFEEQEFLWVVDMLYILIVAVNNWLKRKWKLYHRLEYLLSISNFYTEYRSTVSIIKTSQVRAHVHVQAKTWIEHILHEKKGKWVTIRKRVNSRYLGSTNKNFMLFHTLTRISKTKLNYVKSVGEE